MDAQGNDPAVGTGFLHQPRRGVTVQHRHLKVHQHHVRLKLDSQPHSPSPIRGFANHLHLPREFQQGVKLLPYPRDIVDNEDPDVCHAANICGHGAAYIGLGQESQSGCSRIFPAKTRDVAVRRKS